MRKTFRGKWESWLKRQRKDFAKWAIKYIQGYDGVLPPNIPKPVLDEMQSQPEESRQRANHNALVRYLDALPENDSSHLFLKNLQEAWRAARQAERDESQGIKRVQLLVDRKTENIANRRSRRNNSTPKAELQKMLIGAADAMAALHKENDKLRRSPKSPVADRKKQNLEADLDAVLKEIKEVQEYCLSHIKEYCYFQAGKRPEEKSDLTPKQLDEALDKFSEKEKKIGNMLTKTKRIRERHLKRIRNLKNMPTSNADSPQRSSNSDPTPSIMPNPEALDQSFLRTHGNNPADTPDTES